jgi:predicted Zn-dependent protease
VIKIEALYFDGKSSSQTAVTVVFQPTGSVEITGEDLRIHCQWSQLTVGDRLGNTPRSLYLPDGGKLETRDNDSLDRICAHFATNRAQAWLHKLERHWGLALIALLITISFIWGSIEFGVPVAAKWTAKGVPVSIEQQIGEQGLETLDQWLFQPSKLDPDQQSHIRSFFQTLITNADHKYTYQLEFRHSQQMGANALALPGGIILITDALPKLAENDQQLIAVLAHEIAHVEYQHGLRSLLQNSMTALFMAGLLGDITSVTSLSVTLPTILVESKYSREFELEADRYALRLMQTNNIPPQQFSRILELLTKQSNSQSEYDYLSSHPALDKRITEITRFSEQP